MIDVCFLLWLGIPGFHQGSILSISFPSLFLNSSAAIKQCLKEARDTHDFSSFPCLFWIFLFLFLFRMTGNRSIMYTVHHLETYPYSLSYIPFFFFFFF